SVNLFFPEFGHASWFNVELRARNKRDSFLCNVPRPSGQTTAFDGLGAASASAPLRRGLHAGMVAKYSARDVHAALAASSATARRNWPTTVKAAAKLSSLATTRVPWGGTMCHSSPTWSMNQSSVGFSTSTSLAWISKSRVFASMVVSFQGWMSHPPRCAGGTLLHHPI